MKILFANRMMGTKFGGGENFDWNLSLALQAAGHDVKIISAKRWFHSPVKAPVLPTKFFNLPFLRQYMYRYEFSGNRWLRFFGYTCSALDLWLFQVAIWLKLVVTRPKYDVVQVCALPVLGSWLTKLGYKVVVRWPGPPSPRHLKLMKRYGANVANGDAFKVIRDQFDADVKNINVGLDSTKIELKSDYARLAQTFCFAGRIVPIKNVSLIIKALAIVFPKHPSIKIKIIGEGDPAEIELIRSLANEYGVSDALIWVGYCEKSQLYREMRDSDCFILTSHYDNYPNVIIEAMAIGIPVVATNVGGVSMIVRDGINGILAPKGNEQGVANAIIRMMEEPGLAENLGKSGRRLSKDNFSWAASAFSFEKLYREIS